MRIQSKIKKERVRLKDIKESRASSRPDYLDHEGNGDKGSRDRCHRDVVGGGARGGSDDGPIRSQNARKRSDRIGKVLTARGRNTLPKRGLRAEDRRRAQTESIRNLSLPGSVSGHDDLGASGAQQRRGHVGLEEEVGERRGAVGGGVGGNERGGDPGSLGGRVANREGALGGSLGVDDEVGGGLSDGAENLLGERGVGGVRVEGDQ